MPNAVAQWTLAAMLSIALATSAVAPANAGIMDYFQKKYRNYKDEKTIKDLRKMDKSGAQPSCVKLRAYFMRNCNAGQKWTSYCASYADKCNNG